MLDREKGAHLIKRGEEEIYINIYGNRRNFKQKRRDSKEKKKEEDLRPLTNWVFVCLLNWLSKNSMLVGLISWWILTKGLIAVNYVGCLVCSSFPSQSNGRIVVEIELLLVTESSCVCHTRQTCFSDAGKVAHLKVWCYLMPLVELEGLRCIRLLWTWCIHCFDVWIWLSLEESEEYWNRVLWTKKLEEDPVNFW